MINKRNVCKFGYMDRCIKMPRLDEVCKVNMSLALALVGFDVTIMTIILTCSVPWNWAIEAVGVLLAISIFSLTFSFLIYHTTLATKQDIETPKHAEHLIRKGNLWIKIGLITLISAVPVFLWATAHYIAFGVSMIGTIWIVYHFVIGRV